MEGIILIIILVSSIAVFIDAKILGIKKNTLPGDWAIGAFTWSIAVLLMWPIALPAYLIKRNAYSKVLNKKAGFGFICFGWLLVLSIPLCLYIKHSFKEKKEKKIHISSSANINGYKEYKWGMSLQDALKIETCSYARLQMLPGQAPTDTLTIYCDNSILPGNPATGFLKFKENKLLAIEFIYILNQEAVKMYQQANFEEIKYSQPNQNNNIPKRPQLNTSFNMKDHKLFGEAIKESVINKKFIDLSNELKTIYGPPSMASSQSDLLILDSKNEQKSEFASWMADKKWMSIRANFIVGSSGERFATVLITSKNY